jgi:hypothetical protein
METVTVLIQEPFGPYIRGQVVEMDVNEVILHRSLGRLKTVPDVAIDGLRARAAELTGQARAHARQAAWQDYRLRLKEIDHQMKAAGLTAF